MQGRTRWLFVLLPALALLALSIGAQSTDRWSTLGVATMEPSFGDLRLVTATADCVRSDPDWGIDSPTCDPYGRDWNYPSVWARSFAVLGLGLDTTNAVGYVLIGAFCVACAALMWVATRSDVTVWGMVAGAFAVLSPAGWLALERGNVDLLVFAVLTVAIVLGALERDTAAVPFLAVAASWKVFPIGGALGVVRGLRRVILYVVVFVVTGGFALAFELPAILDRTLRSTYRSFGVAIVPLRLLHQSADDHFETASAIGLGLLVAVTFVLVALDRLANRHRIPHLGSISVRLVDRQGPRVLFLVAAGTFLFSYAMGQSFDYRLIFLIPVVLALAAVRLPPAAVIAWALVGVMYLSARTGTGDELADLVLVVLAPALLVIWCDVARIPIWRRLRDSGPSDARTSPVADGRDPSSA